MKKISICIFILICLIGCKSSKGSLTTIICPSGGPALSLLPIINNEKYAVDIVDGSEILQAEFIKGDKDIIIAPINLGINLSKKTSNYKLAYIVTTSNLYLLSNKKEINKVAAFGEQAIPGKIINYAYLPSVNNIEIDYYESVSEAVSAYLKGDYDAVIASYPLVNKVIKYSNDVEINNLNDFYKNISGFDNYPQAAMFVSNSYIENNNSSFSYLINELSSTNSLYINNKSLLIEELNSIEIDRLGFNNINLVSDNYKELGINIIKANDYENEIINFLSLFNIELDKSLIY